MATVASLVVELSGNVARLHKDMAQAQAVVGRSMSNIERSVNVAKRALGAFGLGIGAVGLVRLIKGALGAQDELSKLSQKVGISVEGLVGLKHAASLSGLSFEGLQKSIKTVSTQMFDASMGLLESKRNFAALGIEIKGTDGTLKSAEAVIVEVADKFAAMADGTNKTALAVKLFGKAGLDMIPMLNEGSAALAQMVAEGQKLNPTTTESARQAEIFNDNMERLTKSVGSVAMAMLNDLLPTLAKVSDKMWEAQKRGEGFWGTMITGLQTFLTGDDAHKLNVQIAQTTDKLLRLQNIGDALRGRPVNPMNLRLLEANNKAIEDTRAELEKLIAIKPILAPERDPEVARRRPSGPTGEELDAREKLAKELADLDKKMRMAAAAEAQEMYSVFLEGEAAATKVFEDERQKRLEALQEFHAGERKLLQEAAKFEMDLAKEREDAELKISLKALDKLAQDAKNAEDMARSLGFTFSSAFEDAAIEGKKLSEVIRGLGHDIARIILRKSITEPLGGAISGAISKSGIGGLFRAHGGPVAAGKPYIVGERGPELMVPGASGSVVPNDALRSMGGGPVFNIDMRGASVEAVARLERLVARLHGSIENRAIGAMRAARARGIA